MGKVVFRPTGHPGLSVQKVDRLRSANDDVRRTELESLGHGLDGVGCNARVPSPRPERSRVRQYKDANVVTEKDCYLNGRPSSPLAVQCLFGPSAPLRSPFFSFSPVR